MRVCVIGAGASGLVTAKKLLDAGLDPIVYERNPDLGGNWLYGAPGSSVYRSTQTVRFADGSEEEADVLLCATGFRLSFPFLDDAYLNLKEGRPVLYKNVFHPRIGNLFFVGFIQPNSGAWFLIELQAELVVRALKHPSPRLRAAIADRQDTRYYDYLPSLRHHLEVDYLRYERDLRKLLKLTGGREEAA